MFVIPYMNELSISHIRFLNVCKPNVNIFISREPSLKAIDQLLCALRQRSAVARDQLIGEPHHGSVAISRVWWQFEVFVLLGSG